MFLASLPSSLYFQSHVYLLYNVQDFWLYLGGEIFLETCVFLCLKSENFYLLLRLGVVNKNGVGGRKGREFHFDLFIILLSV